MNYTLSISTYPNNEIRTVLYRVKAGCPLGDRDDVDSDAAGRVGDFEFGPEIKSESGTDLDISSELSRKRPPGYGGVPKNTRFGLAARRTISRCAGVFDRDEIPKEQCLFLTGTIPGSTKEAFDAVAKWSSWLIKSVKTWISNLQIDDNYSMYCWEFQSRGALHLHYLQLIKDPKKRQVVMWKWAMKWGQLLDVVGKREGVDMWKRADGTTWAGRKGVIQAPAQVVRHSVGSYLSKYLSKSAVKVGNNIEGELMSPVRWWGCSRPLLRRMRELSSEFKIEGVGFSQHRYLWERVVRRLKGLANGFHEYCDKLGFARVAVGYGDDAAEIHHYLRRDFQCKVNHGTVGKCLTGWHHSPRLAETQTSGRNSLSNFSENTRPFAARIRARVCSVLSFGKGLKLFKMPLLNIEPRKRQRQLTIPMLT